MPWVLSCSMTTLIVGNVYNASRRLCVRKADGVTPSRLRGEQSLSEVVEHDANRSLSKSWVF